MSFRNRTEAGKRLADELRDFKSKKGLIIMAIPRGGVIIGYEVANELVAPLDIVIPRKIGAPGNPEYAIGAVTEDGARVLNESAVSALGLSEEYLDEITAKEIVEIKRRASSYREGIPPIQLAGKIVILVDDGLATGATMKAAVQSVRNRGASEIVVAVPVAPPDAVGELSKQVSKVVCPLVVEPFYAIGQFYEDFGQVEDEEVVRLLSIVRQRFTPA